MDFSLSDQTQIQVEAVRRFVRDELQPIEEDVEIKGLLESGIARQIFEKSTKLLISPPKSLNCTTFGSKSQHFFPLFAFSAT